MTNVFATPWLYRKLAFALALMAGAMLASKLSLAADAAIAYLDDINFVALPGDRVEATLSLSGGTVDPIIFTVDEPARIALDFPNTKNRLNWRTKRIGIGMIKSVSAIEAGERTRIVVNLIKQVAYTTEKSPNKIVLTVNNSAPSAPNPSQVKVENLSAQNAAKTNVDSVDFRRGDAGEGRIVVTLSDPNMIADVREEGGRIVAEFLNTTIPNELRQRLDVVDFATPVKTIDTYAEGGNVRIVITPSTEYEHLAYQSENTLTIDVKPIAKSKDTAARKTEYTGEKLSLNFQDIEVRAVLQLLADFSGLNVVVSDTVQGNITLRLKNTPWDQALDIILKTKGLAMRQNGNIILVAPGEEIAAREKLELQAKKQISELAPLRSELIQVNYAKAAVLADILKSDRNTLLSERGHVTVDERTNTLLVRDTFDRLTEIRKLVSSLDIPIRQVLIESRIVIADDKFARDLGVRLGVQNRNESGGNTTVVTDKIPTNSGADPLNINLPARIAKGNPASIALGFLTNNSMLDLELQALQTEGRGEVVSSPRVITSNQRKAVIEQGTEIAYQESTSSGANAAQFKKAVMSLAVTPQITPDDRIILDIKVNKDSVNSEVKGANGAPSIDTNAVTTQVLVDNGETIVLGGIYETRKTVSEEKVPFLGDIPLIGWLFRSKSVVNNKSELLIFVTPKIIKEQFKLQ